MNNGWYQEPHMNGQDNRGMRNGYGQNPYGYGPQMSGGYTNQTQVPQNMQPQQMELFDVIGQGTRVDWVQGEAAMKCYTVRPGTSVILFDMENPKRVYVKAYNMAGVPIYTAGFDLGEIKLGQPSGQVDAERYVSREEYEKSMNQIAQMFAGITGKMGKAEKEEHYECKNEPKTGVGYAGERAESECNTSGDSFPGV